MFTSQISWIASTLVVIAVQSVCGNSSDESQQKLLVGGTDVATVLTKLGAKMEDGLTLQQFDSYQRQFGFTDHDQDGKHSKTEFIDNGAYMTQQARRGIFFAADADKNGFVTKAEYVLNRIITDEAKSIIQAMDGNKDGTVQREEFVKHASIKLKDENLAEIVFATLDLNNDREINIPEYFRVWGRWARFGRDSAEERIATRTNEFRKQTDEKADSTD